MLYATLLLPVLTAFALAQLPRGPSVRSRYMTCHAEDAGRHNFSSQENDHCQADALVDAWEEEIGRAYCKPRTVLVLLNSDPDHEFHPAVVEAQRCGGLCGRARCSPVATSRRRVQVTLTNLLTGSTRCGAVELEEHTKCDCLAAAAKRLGRSSVAGDGPRPRAAAKH